MKKNLKLILIIFILLIITFIMYKIAFKNNEKSNIDNYIDLKQYISDIYGKTFLISDFSDINEADENWLWENVNQYVWNHEDEYKEKNMQEYGYTYEDIYKIVKKLYGYNLKKEFPKGAISMRYNSYRDLYGPTSYGFTNYYDYKIDNITKVGNIYTVSLYDFTVSNENFFGEDTSDDYFEIFNNYDYLLNNIDSTPLLKVKTLEDKDFKNILNIKDKLSHKILTIEYNESDNLYYIISCKSDTKPIDILSNLYHEMELTFDTRSINYIYEDIYTQDEIIVNDFDKLTSIYSENALNTYKNEMNILRFKENGNVYITAGEIDIGYYISKIEFKNISSTANKINCTVIRTFRESFDPNDENYDNTYQKEDEFILIKRNNKWIIDKFNYNNNN